MLYNKMSKQLADALFKNNMTIWNIKKISHTSLNSRLPKYSIILHHNKNINLHYNNYKDFIKDLNHLNMFGF